MSKGNKSKDTNYQRLVEEETLIFEATEVIAELLDAQRVTKKQLADRLGRSKGYVTQVLAGDRNMTLKTLADLAFALNHRIELETTPLERGDSGVPSTHFRKPATRVRPGAARLDHSRCCNALHPPRDRCSAPADRPSASSYRLLGASTPASLEQTVSVGVDSRLPKLDSVAG